MTGIEAHLPAFQVVVPMLTAAFVVLLQPRGLAWGATLAASVLSFGIAIKLALTAVGGTTISYAVGSWPAPFGIAIEIDSLSAVLLLIITGASTVVLAGARESVDTEISNGRQPYFYAAWLLAVAGFCGIAVAGDAFNIFVFMEISSLASYVLIAGGPNRKVFPAVFKYLIMGTIGATFYLIGVGLIYMMTGTLNLSDMEMRIAEVADKRPIYAAAGFITIGLALKAAIFPLHVWLPNAYTWAPNAVTAFLAACATKVSIYVLLRVNFVVFQGNIEFQEIQFSKFFMLVAVLAILVGSAVAMMEKNAKRLFAFSSVSQIGYIVLGASLMTELGLMSSVIHMFNHALAKGAAFLALAGFALVAASMQIEDLRGIAKRMPLTFVAFAIAGLSLIGVPGTAGFISKWYLISAAFELGGLGIALVAVILISSLMAVVYVWRLVETASFGEFQTNKTAVISPILVTAIWVAALSNIVFGFFPDLPVSLAQDASQVLLERTR